MKRWLAATCLFLGIAGPASAADIGIGLRASTLGLGAELSIGLLEHLVFRIPVSGFTYDDNFDESGIRYDGELDLMSVGLLADWHAFGGGFHISGGLASNGNEINLLASEATGNERFEVGNRSYVSDPDDPFELTAGLDFESVAPYLGIGWGNAAQAESRSVYFKFELGALFQGSPRATAEGTGSLCEDTATGCNAATSFDVEGNDPRAQQFQRDLERERQTLEEDISEFDIFPVASLSVGYRF